jgi:hypothetical protein
MVVSGGDGMAWHSVLLPWAVSVFCTLLGGESLGEAWGARYYGSLRHPLCGLRPEAGGDPKEEGLFLVIQIV